MLKKKKPKNRRRPLKCPVSGKRRGKKEKEKEGEKRTAYFLFRSPNPYAYG